MEIEIILGFIIIVCALLLNAVLVLWSRRVITRIDRKNLGNLRDIKRELKLGR
ncbi:MAG TPA: hypothetical protein VMX75_13120 [Spirochaetia bacterium]|nr:hypothetical protein [Spirochaetia bacterium]